MRVRLGLTESGLRSLQNHLDHGLIRVAGHGPGVVVANDVLHAVAIHDDVIHHSNSFTESDEVEIMRKVVEINVGLLEVIRRVEFHFSIL